ncbi:SMP-30/gluconolactonase/LRE family protein [Pelagibacteraceae bacterium]|nr:SMP-30/gluconolactonase/LRE family protein [Pelagibacteraceae bacterium]
MNKVELLDDCNNSLGEGITYSSSNNNLYWLDIGNISKLYSLDLSSNKKEIFELPEIVTATSIKSQNELILATTNGLKLFNTSNEKFESVVNIENQQSLTRSNDGASDALGRFWFGTMQNNFDKNGNGIPLKENIGKLYKVDTNKKISVVEEGLGIPNTFVWSPDNTNFYFTDTLNGTILSYDFELESGELSNKKNFATFDRGHPDGSTIDTDGCVWNCRWGGSCIVRFTPSGKVDQIIEMPVQNITNCVFGEKDMKTLFITTASNEDKNNLDGSLFSINLNYQGIEDNKSKLELS